MASDVGKSLDEFDKLASEASRRLVSAEERAKLFGATEDEKHKPTKNFEVPLESKIAPEPDNINHPQLETTADEYNPSIARNDFSAMDFVSPAELVAFYDPLINEGHFTLHPWQVNISDEIGSAKPSAQNPLKYVLVAANGSGKDKFVIAPFAIWMALTKKRSLTVITSSSGTQLTAQTENYIRYLAALVNRFHGDTKIFEIKQRYIYCTLSGSEIRMFATDEAGKAEGYHPIDPGAEMAIIINEAKSVAPEIFQALTRCSGYNYWLEVSSPGKPEGHLYEAFNNPRWKSRRVSAYDCPHISRADIEDAAYLYGRNSSFFRSAYLALFTSIDEQVVLTKETLDKCCSISISRVALNLPRRAGVDLAAGGDENVLTVVDGNYVIGQERFRIDDTTATRELLVAFFNKWNLKAENIFADDGGVGKSIIDQLAEVGWTINRVNFGGSAINKKVYANRGTELWFNVARLFEQKIIFFNDERLQQDDILKKQLATRYYKQSDSHGKLRLESKREARSNGHPSPDRADSLVLAFAGLTIEDFTGVTIGANPNEPKKRKPRSALLDQAAIVSAHQNKRESILNTMREGLYDSRNVRNSKSNLSPSEILRNIYDSTNY